jgi:hypothetical protein
MTLHESQRGSFAVLAIVFFIGALFGALAYYFIEQIGGGL